ncbi:GcrA family cell cycle regulator [Chelatococcus asaccharovorans]|uniref:GcrA family cell cycle regulator n=1 Tax=Chelatococcus asaccharovorans TaxID=28210 RepID=UPI0014760983|nr:hypothetical protein [Chelatococcus asaccharovorans]
MDNSEIFSQIASGHDLSGTSWTDGRREAALRLWDRGATFSEIGTILSVSRSAVAGFIDRCIKKGMTVRRPKDCGQLFRGRKRSRRSPAPSSSSKSAIVQRRPAEFVNRISLVPEPEPDRPVDLMGLRDRHCRYPLWSFQASPGLFCGQPRSGIRPYCAAHCEVAYRPAPAKGAPNGR